MDGSYLGDLLPGFLIIALGMGFSFVPISIAALAGVPAKDAGLASGLINTSQQIGGALGIAVLSAVAIAQSNDATQAGDAVPQALTSGFQAAFWVGAGVAAAGVLASLFLIRKEELAAGPGLRAGGPSRSGVAGSLSGLARAGPHIRRPRVRLQDTFSGRRGDDGERAGAARGERRRPPPRSRAGTRPPAA